MNRNLIELLFATCLVFLLVILPINARANITVTDEDIEAAITNEYVHSDVIAPHMIDIVIEDGVVTLTGSVSSLTAKKEAEEIAESMTGVRSVTNELSVNPVDLRDADIRNAVSQRLDFNPVIDKEEIDIEVTNGIVTLSGAVGTWHERTMADAVVQEMKGVRDINNEIEVDYPVEKADDTIYAKIEQKLESNQWVYRPSVDVSVREGHVTLTGKVGSAFEKSEAYDEAWVEGVTTVSNLLEVDWEVRQKIDTTMNKDMKTDERIRDTVENALLSEPCVSTYGIDITVEDGIVTLNGEVDNLHAKNCAENAARSAYGVLNVENNLEIHPRRVYTDKEIADIVEKSLAWDSVIERFDIDVHVENRKVYIYGQVDNFSQSHRAEMLAAQVPGVAEVQNVLTVDSGWKWRSDNEIEKEIEEELFWSLLTDSDNIDVQVEDGIASVSGTVNGYSEMDAVIDNAFEGGAKIVENNLTDEDGADLYPEYFYRDRYDWR